MISKSSARNWIVYCAMILVAGGTATAWLYGSEFSDDNIRHTLRQTAQLAFIFFILAIAARPLHQLLRKSWTASLLKLRRLSGVAFSGVMTAHFMLIVLRFSSSPELTYPLGKLLFGASIYGLIGLMFITSFDGPTRALGAKYWKILHRAGLVGIAVVFALPRSLAEVSDPDKLQYTIPVLIVVLMRWAVLLRSRRPGT